MGIFSSIAGIFGGGRTAKGAKQAASLQTEFIRQGLNAVTQQDARNQQNLSPAIGASHAAIAAMMDLLGLGGTAGAQARGAGAGQPLLAPNYDAYVDNNPDLAKAWAEQQGLAKGRSKSDFGKAHWDKIGSQEQRPWTPTTNPLAASAPNGADGPLITADEAQQAAIAKLKDSPLFRSIYGSGEEAILQTAAATGGLRGGNVQRGLADFGADTLSKVILQQLQSLSGVSTLGTEAALGAGQLGNNSAGTIANLFGAQGEAQAGGAIGKALGQNQQTAAIGGTLDSIAEAVASAFTGGMGGITSPGNGVGGFVNAAANGNLGIGKNLTPMTAATPF